LRHLVLLPGFMCDKDLWTDMVPGLAALGTIHHGNVYEDSTLEGMARRVLDGSPERFVLVGFSMGGFVSRALTLTAPERVAGVAFVASSARGCWSACAPCSAGWDARCGHGRPHWSAATATPISNASPARPWSWPAARTGCAASPRASAWRSTCPMRVSPSSKIAATWHRWNAA